MICPEKMGRVVNSMTLQVVSTDECCHNAFQCITILHMELPRETGFKLTTDTPFHINTVKSTSQWYLSLAYRECCQYWITLVESGEDDPYILCKYFTNRYKNVSWTSRHLKPPPSTVCSTAFTITAVYYCPMSTGQQWFGWWLETARPQAISSTNYDISMDESR